MSDLDAFEAKVRRNIKLLSSADPKKRREAAMWLGEAGDPSAITRLRQLYEQDPDRGVRRAAAYSLGMFRALEQGLNGPNQETVVQQLEDIALKGKMGRRVRIPVRRLRQLLVGMLTSLAVLLVFTFVIWPEIADTVGGSGEPISEDINITPGAVETGTVEGQAAALRAASEALRGQYINVLGGGSVDCDTALNPPAPLDTATLPADEADEAAELNALLADWQTASEPFNRACAEDGTPVTPAEASPQLGILNLILARLDGETPGDSQAEDDDPPAEPQTDANMLRPIIARMLDMVDELQTPRGPAGLLNQYWEDIRDTGSTDGCNQPVPSIPADYAPPSDVADLPEDIIISIGLTNTGLELLRQSWAQFTAACGSDNPRAAADAGIQSIRSANSSFDLVREQLNLLLAN